MTTKDDHIEFVKRRFDSATQAWRDLYYKPKMVNDLVLCDRKDIAVAFLTKYLKSDSKVLDAGCGAGVVALDIVKKGFYVHGIDISPQMIALCKRSFEQAEIDVSQYTFSTKNLAEPDLPAASFDAIVALGVLEYQQNEHEILRNFRKIVKPGGVLICSGPIKTRLSNYFGLGSLLVRICRTIGSRISKKISKPVRFDINHYSLCKLRVLLEMNGFDVREYMRHGYADFSFMNRLIGAGGNIFLHRIFTKLSGILPIDRWANDIVMVSIRKRVASEE